MSWKQDLQQNINDLDGLRAAIPKGALRTEGMEDLIERFPMSIPSYYLSLIDWDQAPEDPIYKMCVPSMAESDMAGSFDTSGEGQNTVMQGLQHKYPDTVLILSTQACAMYCRHCFRKRLVGLEGQRETMADIAAVTDYVAQHPEVSNVLISGGDSFLNSNARIRQYLENFTAMDHLDLIRFGTRLPVVLPQRIYEDSELLDLLREYNRKKQIYIITQFNHPREITAESDRAIQALLEAGMVIKNQTVLLKGVNDEGTVLGTLMRQLTSIGITPYYIFQCRPVSGVKGHFQVPLRRGYNVVEDARFMQNGQGKGARFILSHETGKMEVLGPIDEQNMIFKYHHVKSAANKGRLFTIPVTADQTWIESI